MTTDVILVPEIELVVETANQETVIIEVEGITSIIEVVETIVETADPQIDVLEVAVNDVVIDIATITEILEVGTSVGSADASVPIVVGAGEKYTVPANRQALFAYPMTIDGEMQLDGVLVEVL